LAVFPCLRWFMQEANLVGAVLAPDWFDIGLTFETSLELRRSAVGRFGR
jgi:hypothetical protein